MPEDRLIPIRNVASRMLCARHNGSLHRIDASVVRLAQFLSAHRSGASRQALLVSGEDVERWLVKLLLGYSAAGMVKADGVRVHDLTPTRPSLDFLFGASSIIPANCGLYTFNEPGMTFPAIQIAPYGFATPTGVSVYAITLRIFGLTLHLTIDSERSSKLDAKDRWYRPGCLRLPGASSQLLLCWNDEGTHPMLDVKIV